MSIRRKHSEEALQSDAAANGGRSYQQCAVSVMDTIHHPEIDFPFALKKLGFTEQEFYDYIDAPRVEHGDYNYFRPFWWDLPLIGKLRR